MEVFYVEVTFTFSILLLNNFIIRGGVIFSQTVYITNGSFEDTENDTSGPLWPYFIHRAACCGGAPGDPFRTDVHGAEVTRCLGDWGPIINGQIFNSWDQITIPYRCDKGWYQPTAGTADYFNRMTGGGSWYQNVADDVLPVSEWGKMAKVPYNFYNQSDEMPKPIQEPFRYLTREDAVANGYCGILNVRKRTLGGEMDMNWKFRKNEYLQKKLENPLLPGHHYRVSFRVSKGPTQSPTIFYRKKALTAYFSKDPIMLGGEGSACNARTP